MKKKSVEELKAIAKDLRKKVVTMIYEAQSGHPGGSPQGRFTVARSPQYALPGH